MPLFSSSLSVPPDFYREWGSWPSKAPPRFAEWYGSDRARGEGETLAPDRPVDREGGARPRERPAGLLGTGDGGGGSDGESGEDTTA